MAKSAATSVITISVLDRLIDEDPRTSTEAPPTRSNSMRQLRSAVCRDLEWLLNTRKIAVLPSDSLRELNRSVYVYGLPDFTAYGFASPDDQAKLLRSMQAVVQTFEPRLKGVRIVPLEVAGKSRHRLHFRIEALLDMDPAPEPITFDTTLELSNGNCEVK